MTPAEIKEAEANGASLKEVKSEVSSNSSSEDIAPFQKRSRRKECIFISIAVVLGAGLIAVLVYFSVTNALKEDEPVARKSEGDDLTSTTPEYGMNYDYQTGNDYGGGQQTRDATGDGPGAGGTLRSLPEGPQARALPAGPETRSMPGGDQPMGPMLRGLPKPPGFENEVEESDGGQAPERSLRTLPKGPDSDTPNTEETGNVDNEAPPSFQTRRLLPPDTEDLPNTKEAGSDDMNEPPSIQTRRLLPPDAGSETPDTGDSTADKAGDSAPSKDVAENSFENFGGGAK